MEIGWLIEANGECIGVVEGEIAWVPYTYENTLRFARKIDAENMLEYLVRNHVTPMPLLTFVADHAWCTTDLAEFHDADH